MGPPLFERMSNSQPDSGMWQLRQAILPDSPIAPSCPSAGVPVWIGPDSRGSKKSFWPSRAAVAESRYLLVVSTGRAGRGERLRMVAHSEGEKPSWPDCPHSIHAAATAPKQRNIDDLRMGAIIGATCIPAASGKSPGRYVTAR